MTGKTQFEAMFDVPMEEPRHAHVQINWRRPDGSIWADEQNVYDMLSPVAVGTINRNLRDGYQMVELTIVQS